MNLFSDLDNTLIYSHRRNLPEPKITVEWLNGKQQSFMTEKTFDFLSDNSDIHLIPVTTRSIEQYRRLTTLTNGLKVSYAIVCNGGILLNNGIVDADWMHETLKMIEPAYNEFMRVKEVAYELCGEDHIHDVEGIMFYGKSEAPQQIANALSSKMDLSKIGVFCDNRKFYCLPNVINKGIAVQRFSKRFNITIDIAVGDGIADIPMLEVSHFAIAPKAFNYLLNNRNVAYIGEGKILSNEVCSIVKKHLEYENV